MRSLLRRTLIAVVVATCACAHAPPAPAAPAAPVFWPPPPQKPRVRLDEMFPDRRAPPPRRALWLRVLAAIVGLKTRDEDEEPLQRPFDVAVEEPAGDLLVADPDGPAVIRKRPGRTPVPVRCPDREWNTPIALALSADGALLVADAGAGEIVRIGRDARCTVLGAGELERPTGVAAVGGKVYVTDPPRHEVVVLTSGGVLARYGSLGEGDGHFDFPTSIAAARDGTLLVVDALNFRVVRLSPDGRWLGSFGTRGDEGAAFARPKGVATDDGGRVYVSDAQRDLVLVFLEDGSFDYAIGESGDGPGRFAHPAGVRVRSGRIYVADSYNRRVQVFEVVGDRS